MSPTNDKPFSKHLNSTYLYSPTPISSLPAQYDFLSSLHLPQTSQHTVDIVSTHGAQYIGSPSQLQTVTPIPSDPPPTPQYVIPPPNTSPIPNLARLTISHPTPTILSPSPPRTHTAAAQEEFSLSLPAPVQAALNDTQGKSLPISFTGELRFRHVIPHLVSTRFLDPTTLATLEQASALVRLYRTISAEYSNVDPTTARGYSAYSNAKSETDLNHHRIRASSAALLRLGCNIEKLVRYLGGPHLGAHRNVPAIMKRLRPSCDPHHLAELHRVFTTGAPKCLNATNTEANLLKYYRYGNHSTINDNPSVLHKVLVKDSKRGNVIIFDDRLFAFIPHSHTTPQGLADHNNPWKNARSLFDSSFRPDQLSMAINDWTSKHTEPPVTYPGSFSRYLVWLWNLRITYPNDPIFQADDDVTNAFRLIKTNPCAVAMHLYRVEGHTVAATGQTFGDSYSPANFEPAAICRQQHAQWLWKYRSDNILERAQTHVSNIKLVLDPSDTRPFAQANADLLNPGALNPDGTRIPPPYPMQVDDCLYADIARYFPRTVAASITALEDVFDGHHPYMEPPLSLEKLDPVHHEHRVLLGHYPDTRSMTVQLSPRRAEKIITYIAQEGWLSPNHKATIRQIATITGLLDSACEFFPWGRAQLLVLYDLLRTVIKATYGTKRALDRVYKRKRLTQRLMPTELQFRLRWLEHKWLAQDMWNRKSLIPIPDAARHCLTSIHTYIKADNPWEQPIGHIVARVPDATSFTDASHTAIGVTIPRLRVWCILPYTAALHARIKLGLVHINALEFVGVLLAYIMALERHKARPQDFNPTPVIRAMCDNTSANAWWKKMSTHSTMGQNLIKLYAEYQLLAPVCSVAEHIKGVDNVVADNISRPEGLFSPNLSPASISSTPFPTLVRQVCLHYRDKKHWDLFLPSAELLSSLNSQLSTASSWERPKKPRKSGRFVPVASTFFDGPSTANSSIFCSL